jgi:hypothetical protein
MPHWVSKTSNLSAYKDIIVPIELSSDGAIDDPPTLVEEFQLVIEQFIKVHHRPSTCARAASAWGCQKVISML